MMRELQHRFEHQQHPQHHHQQQQEQLPLLERSHYSSRKSLGPSQAQSYNDVVSGFSVKLSFFIVFIMLSFEISCSCREDIL